MAIVNGESREVARGTTVARLLEELGLAGRRVAVEVNREVVLKRDFATHEIGSDDTIEIVQFVGGG